jgi:hypothetical protein
MQDLRLWRLLRQPEPPAAEIIPLLEQLTALPLAERYPFFGPLPRALAHPEDAVRAAAVRALSGASGPLAYRQIVALLHDPEPAVHLAALEALRQSSSIDPPRWAHALFHPRPEVRRAALDPNLAFPLAPWHALYLLPDPGCADLVSAHLARAPVPARLLPLLFDYLERRLLDRPLARRLIADMPWAEIEPQLSVGQVRSPADASFVLIAALGADTAAGVPLACGRDPLDELFDLFWDADPADAAAGEAGPASRFFDGLGKHLLGLAPESRQRVMAALVVTAARRGFWPGEAAAVCGIFHPDFLRFAWVPRDVRYEAVKALYALGERCPRRSDAEVKELVLSPLARRPSGGLDLWVVGGLLHLLAKEPYKTLQEWVSLNRIVSSFLEDMEYAVPFLALKDNSERGSPYLLEEIFRARRPQRPLLLALLTYLTPADRLDSLPAIAPHEATEVFLEIRRLGVYRGLTLSPSKKVKVAEILGDKVADGELAGFLAAWLALPDPEEVELGLLILGLAARGTGAAQIVLAALALDLDALRRLLRVVAWCAGFPYDREVELARALAGHGDPEVREWAEVRLPAGSAPPPAPKAPTAKVSRLTPAQVKRIATCADSELNGVLAVCMAEPRLGLCAALGRRPTPPHGRLDVCTALLACHDPLDEVAGQLARFIAENEDFIHRLDRAMVKTWQGERRLPLAGHAWLFRWEEHGDAFAQLVGDLPGNLLATLRFADVLPVLELRRRLWDAAAHLVSRWRWHDGERFGRVCCQVFADFLVDELAGAQGEPAARMLAVFYESRVSPVLMARLREQVLARLPDLPAPVRHLLSSWIDARGLPPAAAQPRASRPAEDVLVRIHTSTDLDQLAAWCAADVIGVAEEAALRLVELGEAGVGTLAELLRRARPVAALRSLAVTISLWPDGPARRGLGDLVGDETAPAEARFLAGLGLFELGERGLLADLLAIVCRESGNWFRPEDWQRLLHLGVAERELALRLAVSPQPHAYNAAVRALTEDTAPYDVEARLALLRFLEAGTERLDELRIRAALRLHGEDDHAGFPLVLRHYFTDRHAPRDLFAVVPADLTGAAVTTVLTVGAKVVDERWLIPLLQATADAVAQEEALGRLLAESASDAVRTEVVSLIRPGGVRERKLRRVAEAFAWGIRAGRELTGHLFAVQMIAGQGLGYTRFEENKLYINPLPILRGDKNGRPVVEGLLLHELGHHVYHRGPEKQAVWTEAERAGLHSLLNLVADEHLERNLRGLDEDYGDRLKKLVAFAFQHAMREVPVDHLLACLQGRAFPVLPAVRLGAARLRGCVVIEGGRVLLEMEKAGLSFARFVRALRMGLGNRHADPKVAEGLALFRKRFRASSMPELLDIARRLREIFGWETSILASFAQDELLRGCEGDLLCHGEGITDAEVESEIRRVLNPPPRRLREDSAPGKPGPRWINVNPNEQFDLIPTVVQVPYDRAEHAPYAAKVARHARRMRRYLEELGLAYEAERFRIRGRSLDRTRVKAVVLHGDPRMLIARELRVRTDLFLGVLIDCSGSMASRNNIEKAKLFGALLAEAARGFRGIDLRLFGFTDRVIYDAGTAGRCAVHGLRATDGNNDAAALWHAAQQARASRRRAKLLVMISDGLPTECSVAALKGLVRRLGQRLHICCAQVAVQPLAEICFPHYVLLEEGDLDASVRRFGAVVARLVQTAMRV